MNIGLLPISAKPYHAGHHALVEMAAGANDEVLLYVSISDRKRKGELPISGADMKKVWEEEIEQILPGNVTPVYGGSPVGHVFDILRGAEEKLIAGDYQGHVYTVYSDPTDTAQNYKTTIFSPDVKRWHPSSAEKIEGTKTSMSLCIRQRIQILST